MLNSIKGELWQPILVAELVWEHGISPNYVKVNKSNCIVKQIAAAWSTFTKTDTIMLNFCWYN